MVKKKNIAIIPARGGSKRIPQKNIVDFHSKPMIAWTIEAAKNSNIFDTITVSTDDQKIREISQKYGASVPFLRDNYCDDYSNISQVTLYTLEEIKTNLGETYENVFQLMANCPLRNSLDILKAYKHFVDNKKKPQISCFKFGWMNPWWSFKIKNNLTPDFMFPDGITQRSQDLENLYCPTGAIWISKTTDLKKHKRFYTNNTIFCPIDWKSAIDIDNYEDLEMAKAIFLMQNKKTIQ